MLIAGTKDHSIFCCSVGTMANPNRSSANGNWSKYKTSLKEQPSPVIEEKEVFGMTSAISYAVPTIHDVRKTEELKDGLKSFGIVESQEDLYQRLEILASLNAILQHWLTVDSKEEENIYYDPTGIVRGKIFTFGSYRLGVHTKDADIDTLCVVPRHVNRKEFFSSFYELLKQHDQVTELRAIEEAFVPVIKMRFGGIELDMVFARLALKEIPHDLDLRDEAVLKNVDITCVRSLNGCRVTDEILHLVPLRENFKLALRAIKLWAKKQGIYSNILGYLGGVSWAMLVARTSQLYPRAAAATLIRKFFLIFSQWKWPIPVLLKAPEHNKLGFPVWDPRVNVADRYHLMPIITPVYPQFNSSFNVNNWTRSVIVDALKQGLLTVEDIMTGQAPWSKLFERPNFFEKYRHYIVLTIKAASKDDYLIWHGLVESKIRLLINSLDYKTSITLAHVNPESYPTLEPLSRCHSSIWLVGLLFEKSQQLNVNLTQPIAVFVEKVHRKATSANILKEGMKIEAKHALRKQLKEYLPEHVLPRIKSKRTNDRKVDASSKKFRPG